MSIMAIQTIQIIIKEILDIFLIIHTNVKLHSLAPIVHHQKVVTNTFFPLNS